MEAPPLILDRHDGETGFAYGRRVHLMLLEQPAFIPDDRADKVLDACPTFESRRAALSWRATDLLAAVACVVLALGAAVWL